MEDSAHLCAMTTLLLEMYSQYQSDRKLDGLHSWSGFLVKKRNIPSHPPHSVDLIPNELSGLPT